MKLKIRILSGILVATMLFPCIGVGAEDECSAQVVALMQKIEKNVGVMSLSTESAWNIYRELVEMYNTYFLNKEKLVIFYNVLLKSEQNTCQMSVTDLNLMNSVYALRDCYEAFFEEYDTNYESAHKKWEESYKKYCTLSETVANIQDIRNFELMADFCKRHSGICLQKMFSYNKFFEDITEKILKDIEELQKNFSVNEEQISILENFAIYQLLEPLRELIKCREKEVSQCSFISKLNECNELIEIFKQKFFKHRCNEIPRFKDKLEQKVTELAKKADSFKKSPNIMLALAYYSVARKIVCFTEKSRGESYRNLSNSIKFCRLHMRV